MGPTAMPHTSLRDPHSRWPWRRHLLVGVHPLLVAECQADRRHLVAGLGDAHRRHRHAVPAIAIAGPVTLGGREVALLAASGFSNVIGILFVLTALRSGKVSVVGPITSTEGAIGAVIAVVAGEQLAPGRWARPRRHRRRRRPRRLGAKPRGASRVPGSARSRPRCLPSRPRVLRDQPLRLRADRPGAAGGLVGRARALIGMLVIAMPLIVLRRLR